MMPLLSVSLYYPGIWWCIAMYRGLNPVSESFPCRQERDSKGGAEYCNFLPEHMDGECECLPNV